MATTARKYLKKLELLFSVLRRRAKRIHGPRRAAAFNILERCSSPSCEAAKKGFVRVEVVLRRHREVNDASTTLQRMRTRRPARRDDAAPGVNGGLLECRSPDEEPRIVTCQTGRRVWKRQLTTCLPAPRLT
ncbi:unnamed protein product [Amoebophrya sp. A120]|nr:unnamed protein product [Amoebophrya sp. A120]|eukprot:GSA120T00012045001.1